MRHCGVAVLEKGLAIPCGLRLALTHLGSSESINTILTEYLLMQVSATAQMAVCRPARREPSKYANAALQSLARGKAIPYGQRLALAHLGDSEVRNIG